MKRYYDIKNRCCSYCEMLCTKQSFKRHSIEECFMIEMKNKKLMEEIKNFKGVKDEPKTI